MLNTTRSAAFTSRSRKARGAGAGRVQRRQTLKNVERYITPELKTFEDKALAANDRALAAEKRLFEELLQNWFPHSTASARPVRRFCRAGCSGQFRGRAETLSFSRPVFTPLPCLELAGARHPVIESLVDQFILNDLRLDSKAQLRDPHQTEHGRQKHLHATGRAGGDHGLRRVLRRGDTGDDRANRPRPDAYRRRTISPQAVLPSWLR